MKHLETTRAGLIRPLVVVGLSLLMGVRVWAQTDTTPSQQPVPAMVGLDKSSAPAENYNPDTSEDRMLTPPPVSGQTYPIALSSEERANYLRGGLSFTSAYTDNAVGAVNSHPVSDISYSIFPTVSVDRTTARLHYLVDYAPGFTFYQHTSSLNQADHNASIEFEYRLSPHVTFSARDSFQKSSSVFNQPPDFSAGGVVSGGTQSPNFSVIAPIADRLSNLGNAGITYQFGLNDMVGGSGTFSNLHYPNPEQVSGLYDATSQAGLAFYSHRVAKGQYIGVTYEYQRLVSYPTLGANETQTHAAVFFYTFAPRSSRFSLSLFGGPQHSDTVQPAPLPRVQSWTPVGGASLGWQGRTNSFALSYSHVVASGSGLVGAVQLDSATASVRQQITRSLNVSVTGGYAQNNVLGSPIAGMNNGHSLSGTAFLQQMFGQHVGVQLGYTRLHQTYSNVEAISGTPDTNREFISISYQFSRPLGR